MTGVSGCAGSLVKEGIVWSGRELGWWRSGQLGCAVARCAIWWLLCKSPDGSVV